MCGIVGIISNQSEIQEKYRDDIQDSLKLLKHRGPDDNGIFSNERLIFGHVRLSILDLSDAGSQPMTSSDDNLAITYNGEVYNFKDIRGSLKPVEKFKSNTDTEVILKFYNSLGVESFEKLNGMFAFAIFDKIKQKVFLVRDRFGIKPLYYKVNSSEIIFSSEIKAIKRLDPANDVIDIDGLSEWTYYGNALREKTLYKNIRKVLPGTYLEIDLENLEIAEKTFWSPEKIKQIHKPDPQSVIKKTKQLIEEAVKKQLVSDVEVGIFLSGGIDSSTITAFASRHYQDKLNTYSVGFDYEDGINELPKAREVAELFGTNHHEILIDSYDLVDTIEHLIDCHDLPFSDAANIPLFLLSKKLGGKIKVILQGDGGDEIFGGYRRYSTLSRIKNIRPFLPMAKKVHSILPKTYSFYLRQRYLNAISHSDDSDLMAMLLTVEDRDKNLFNIYGERISQELKDTDPFSAYQDCNDRFHKNDIIQKMLFTDTQIILPDIFCEKVDRSTMASSIEVRVPLLDNELTEYVMSLPSDFKVKGSEKKWLIKKVMDGILPHKILYGKKTGFSVPFQFWIKGPLLEYFYVLKNELNISHPHIFNWNNLDNIIQENSRGIRDHSFLLWKIMNLMIWLKKNREIDIAG